MNTMNNRVMKILIIRRSALGDTIHTLPTAKAIRDKYPDAQIDWVVEDKAAMFVVNNPLLDKVYIINKKKDNIIDFFRLIGEIRKEKYDIVLDTQQLLKSAVIMGLSGGKRKIALSDGREFSGFFANEIIKTNRKQFDINYHVVKRNLEMAGYLGCNTDNIQFVLPESSDDVKNRVKNLLATLDPNLKTIVICPETTWANKHWTVAGWQNIIKEFCGKVNIVYTGTLNDNGLCEAILSKFEKDNIINLRGKTNLQELAEVFRYSNVVVSPDSGSAHIAWAVDKPAVITLFFATSGLRTAPFGDKYFYVQAECECSPCMKKRCKNLDANKCLELINSQKIVKILQKVLQFD